MANSYLHIRLQDGKQVYTYQLTVYVIWAKLFFQTSHFLQSCHWQLHVVRQFAGAASRLVAFLATKDFMQQWLDNSYFLF